MPTRCSVSEDQAGRIKHMREIGLTNREIGSALGKSQEWASNAALLIGLDKRKVGAPGWREILPPVSKQVRREDEAEARIMAENGRPLWWIAEWLGWTEDEVATVVGRR